jgi:hypothetical protein
MKKTEVRYGNLAMNAHGRVVEITDIDGVGKLEPIPLTEEWLLKFGFEKNILYDGRWHHGGFTNPNAPLFYYSDMSLSGSLLFSGGKQIKIETVNQLQNLYFYLCGEELTIK